MADKKQGSIQSLATYNEESGSEDEEVKHAVGDDINFSGSDDEPSMKPKHSRLQELTVEQETSRPSSVSSQASRGEVRKGTYFSIVYHFYPIV